MRPAVSDCEEVAGRPAYGRDDGVEEKGTDDGDECSVPSRTMMARGEGMDMRRGDRVLEGKEGKSESFSVPEKAGSVCLDGCNCSLRLLPLST